MGKYVIRIPLIGCLLLLSSCTGSGGEQYPPMGFDLYQSQLFSMAVPLGFTYSETAPSGTYYYFGYPEETDNGMSTVEFYENVQSCSSYIAGASQTVAIGETNGNTSWGKVDAWDSPYPGDDTVWRNVLCRLPNTSKTAAAYALCSEKDGKRVLICISQITDNPQLVEEIFRTFRWGD